MRWPSGLNATLVTASVWPVIGGPTGWPDPASQRRRVLSLLAETMRRPSGLNATLLITPPVGMILSVFLSAINAGEQRAGVSGRRRDQGCGEDLLERPGVAAALNTGEHGLPL